MVRAIAVATGLGHSGFAQRSDRCVPPFSSGVSSAVCRTMAPIGSRMCKVASSNGQPVDDSCTVESLPWAQCCVAPGPIRPPRKSGHRHAVDAVLPADLLLDVGEVGPGDRRRHRQVAFHRFERQAAHRAAPRCGATRAIAQRSGPDRRRSKPSRRTRQGSRHGGSCLRRNPAGRLRPPPAPSPARRP